MHSIPLPADVSAALDALDAAVARIGNLDFAGLSSAVRLRVLEAMENSHRRQIAVGTDVIAGLVKEDPGDVGGPVHKVVADWLRISYADACRRVRDARQLSPRLTLTGQELPPELPATAAAWRSGLLDGQHLRVIQAFVRDLPDAAPAEAVDAAERFLASQAAQLRPDQLQKVAHQCALWINPDGKFSDTDRARQRGFSWGAQRLDGMSVGKLVASPELRANLDAWLARFAAPGMCNPDDETPCVEGEPSEQRANGDARSHAQRQHDAINALVRGQLGDPKLGQHNGLPVAVIVSTTLQELTGCTGRAVTGGGTVLPMRDVIRMASHAYHYLAVFDEHSGRPLYLGRTRRIATPDQRVVLYAKDRGCTHPGCDAPGYWCEVHHLDDWSTGGVTDADKLTFACTPHHKLIEKGWRTRKLPNGRTEWIPPPHNDRGQRTNDYHHPERLSDP
ncbi:maturase [Mycobacterium sp. 852002-53434_SCH5985345]|uniref:HNH endonuclease signature motif containing protein n=1 Tax=unclassified Mycobacterium TaxID=2642494 RepID=UPI0007FC5197|nr:MULTISPECIES: HNH endonuclease signature motif containing protein [unclassified Mycobacterium]OBF57772.1 maturase [Mycobacterium sp. 852002-53434_SCH5985345]OBF75181.1 maturase [Mycobacterium sp. 852002-51613_SCH5001154]